jgi:hypothetical protein
MRSYCAMLLSCVAGVLLCSKFSHSYIMLGSWAELGSQIVLNTHLRKTRAFSLLTLDGF